jgi:hypothetical protein
MRRVVVVLAVLSSGLFSGALLAGCGGGGSGSSGTNLPVKVIDITFRGDTVTPNGERVPVAPGQRIELDVTADKPGQIHVHSDPEQELSYDKGSTTIQVTPIRTPGLVTVESHALDKVIVQLQVQ